MRQILLIGSNGQLGTTLKIQSGFQKKLNLIPLERKDCDLLNYKKVEEKIHDINPDIVINIAAFTDVEKAELEPTVAMNVNYHAAVNLANICNVKNIPLIHLSTDYVFDGEKKALYVETDYSRPLNVYGNSKLFAEKNIIYANKKTIIIRSSWFFSKYKNNFVTKILNLATTKNTFSVIDDVYGTPTSCDDLADCILHICHHLDTRGSYNQYGIYHFSGYPTASWYSFAETILKIFKLEKDTHLVKTCASSLGQLAVRPKFSGLDSSKIQAYWNIKPSSWEDSLEKMKDLKVNNL